MFTQDDVFTKREDIKYECRCCCLPTSHSFCSHKLIFNQTDLKNTFNAVISTFFRRQSVALCFGGFRGVGLFLSVFDSVLKSQPGMKTTAHQIQVNGTDMGMKRHCGSSHYGVNNI